MLKQRIYLDYSATTPLAREVNAAMYDWGKRVYGNPSSPHRFGQQAKAKLEDTRDILGQVIGCQSKEILFSSGGTESNNLAVIGVARSMKAKGNHLLFSAVEHPSVLETRDYLQEQGFEISLIKPDNEGRFSLQRISEELRPETILVSIMYINNETGIIHPMAEIGNLCRTHRILFHCDAVQAFGKIPFSFPQIKADLLTISGHKIYGPKGIGALIIREGIPLKNIHFGGGQEANRRPGTENMSGVVGLGAAIRLLDQYRADYERVTQLQQHFEQNVVTIFSGTQIIGDKVKRSPFISCISFPGLDNESLLLNLDLAGIAVSVGSACSSGSIKQSQVLTAMNLPAEIIKGALRFSFGRFTTRSQIEYTLEQLEKIISRLCR